MWYMITGLKELINRDKSYLLQYLLMQDLIKIFIYYFLLGVYQFKRKGGILK